MNNPFEVRLFGRIAIRRGSAELSSFITRKAAELLVLLTIHAGEPLARRDIIGLLWPGSQGPKAGNRLSATLYGLRQGLSDSLGTDAANVIRAQEGTLRLEGDVVSDLQQAESAWQSFRQSSDEVEKIRAVHALCERYTGHLAADLDSSWLEPQRSLWASRWTECLLWLSDQNGDIDTALAAVSSIQPVLRVSRNLAARHLDERGRTDFAESWREESVSSAANNPSPRGLRAHRGPKIFNTLTTTYLMVQGVERAQLEPFAHDSDTTIITLGDGGYAVPLRNPLAARVAASRLRVQYPKASIYISTRVCDPHDEVPAPLIERYREVRGGETLINPPAATLIEMHELDVILERRAGRSEYRLL